MQRKAVIPAHFLLLPALLLAGCHSGHDANVPGDSSDRRPYAEIAEGEVLHFTGTEPFWSGQAAGGRLTYATPEKPEGQSIAVQRFGGRGGLSFSGTLEGRSLDLMVTPGSCSDGMSDRTYPFTVTLQIAGALRKGCAWSDVHPFSGPEHPGEGKALGLSH